MSEKYSNTIRKEYIEKCDQPNLEWYNCFLNAITLKKLMRELNPIDLGGLFVPADDLLLKVKFTTKDHQFLDDILWEPTGNDEQLLDSENSLKKQYKCSGEQILTANFRVKELIAQATIRILEMIKENDNLYLFDEAAKVFPEKKVDKLPDQTFTDFLLNVFVCPF
jgi:hypothetical protein